LEFIFSLEILDGSLGVTGFEYWNEFSTGYNRSV